MDFLLIILGSAVVTLVASFAIIRVYSKKQKIDRETALQQQRKPYEMLAADFARVGWPAWGYSAHLAAGQDDRIKRAINSRNMHLIGYNADTKVATVQGERGAIYEITPKGCSCPDFATRSLPCKHMYFAAMEIPESAE